jgi:hypothetical protein
MHAHMRKKNLDMTRKLEDDTFTEIMLKSI